MGRNQSSFWGPIGLLTDFGPHLPNRRHFCSMPLLSMVLNCSHTGHWKIVCGTCQEPPYTLHKPLYLPRPTPHDEYELYLTTGAQSCHLGLHGPAVLGESQLTSSSSSNAQFPLWVQCLWVHHTYLILHMCTSLFLTSNQFASLPAPRESCMSHQCNLAYLGLFWLIIEQHLQPISLASHVTNVQLLIPIMLGILLSITGTGLGDIFMGT